MTYSNITGIFPTPIFQYNNVKEITVEELNLAENEADTYRNAGNSTSLDSYILDRKEFKDLKNVLTDKINNYFQEVYTPVNKDLELYITQSWLNYTAEGEYHHPHFHSNSIASGVFYFKADKQVDQICFEKRDIIDDFRTLSLDIISEGTTDFNAKLWGVDVESNMLVVFPSTVIHTVQQNKGDSLRISLAFNTFIKGTLGSRKTLTELKLP